MRIKGSGFTGATAVDFGGDAATNVVVDNDSLMTCASPAGSGTVDVTVTTPAGTSALSSADRFTYTVAPIVSGFEPSDGLDAGGTTVTISGSGFTGATAVTFSGNEAEFKVVSEHRDYLYHPLLGIAGDSYGIEVTTRGGTARWAPGLFVDPLSSANPWSAASPQAAARPRVAPS